MKEDIRNLIRQLDAGEIPTQPNNAELMPLYESIVLMQRRYEERIREMMRAESERDAFYGEVQQIRAEHHTAEQIQRSLLPTDSAAYPTTHNVDLFGDMDTAWEIGGDYYDYFAIDDRHIFFCIGDVSGKGVSAAIFCAVVKTLIQMMIREGRDLAEVCNDVSARMYETQQSAGKMFVTLWAGILDTVTGMLQYVNAGHELPVLVSREAAPAFCGERTGIPIASYYNKKKLKSCTYEKREMVLSTDDLLILYTDGLTDSEDTQGTHFNKTRLLESCKELSGGDISARDAVSYLQRRIVSFADRGERDDDITLLAVRRLSPEIR